MTKERIVVSASEYEIPLGNLPGIPSRYKYNFIAPAIKQLKEFKSEYPNDKITWLISSLGYSPQDINNFKDTAKKLNVKVLFFDDISQLIYYINADRTFYKISSLVVFSHGIINSVEFRYRPSYLGGSTDPLTLGINDISKLNSS
ncbi:hypothetical protein [Clostridium algidicarnis]|uniref:hypothetical protein n=1 Tax=Clostridium algidicarnis TaxID=37659 RepID=UPI001C0B9D6A|nr:hypothetical protein [Clostridium algidicarnis]MBU3210685.1 hypothetical protein [Clostridium algidicarnis]MBU3229136.1 hypothetical protein [Clostridium algidicarnis]MBU3252631.1 hypothetical protein [Clostridium algidicarnis]